MKVNTLVIPVAGLGSRFLTATKAVPKEMLPIVDTPVIELIIEEAYEAGIENVVFIYARDKTAIANHFDSHIRMEIQLEEQGKLEELEKIRRVNSLMNYSFIRQSRLLGVGHAILQARPFIDGKPFAVAFPDDLIKSKTPCLGQLIRVYEEHESSVAALEPVPLELVDQYGIIKGKRVGDRLYQLDEMVEKPMQQDAPSNLAIVGRYVLTPEIFEYLSETEPDDQGQIQLTDAMAEMLAAQKMYGLVFEGKRYDTGSIPGFLKATVDYALERRDLSADFLDYLREKLAEEN